MCDIERRGFFKEVSACVSECLRSRSLESSPNLPGILGVMKHCKEVSVMKLLTLSIN